VHRPEESGLNLATCCKRRAGIGRRNVVNRESGRPDPIRRRLHPVAHNSAGRDERIERHVLERQDRQECYRRRLAVPMAAGGAIPAPVNRPTRTECISTSFQGNSRILQSAGLRTVPPPVPVQGIRKLRAPIARGPAAS
jgi:hypothetical protein